MERIMTKYDYSLELYYIWYLDKSYNEEQLLGLSQIGKSSEAIHYIYQKTRENKGNFYLPESFLQNDLKLNTISSGWGTYILDIVQLLIQYEPMSNWKNIPHAIQNEPKISELIKAIYLVDKITYPNIEMNALVLRFKKNYLVSIVITKLLFLATKCTMHL